MTRSKLPSLLLLAMPLVALAACAGETHIQAQLPQAPAQDLAVKPKPVMPDTAITDDTVNAQYNSDVEAWGDEGWAQVARLCRWSAANKLTNVVCPKP